MNKTIIIAEAGVNHNGDLEKAKQLIDVAAEAGVDYVKFQTFKTENLVSKKAQKTKYQIENLKDDAETTQFGMLKKLELDLQAHHFLMDYCKTKNIKFLSTAFDLESIDLLANLNLDLFKIPSGEITNLPYLEKIASHGKETVLSTGMAKMSEIEAALKLLLKSGLSKKQITILHCNTEYPTPMEDVNLKAMLSIQEKFQLNVGYSDHTLGIEIPIAAVAMGASLIEKHFTLDKNLPGPDHKASLEPAELKAMVSGIRNIEKAMGDGIKKPSQSEIKNIVPVRKSIHLARKLKANYEIEAKDLIMKRPANGISPMEIKQIIGKKIITNLPADHQLKMSDLK